MPRVPSRLCEGILYALTVFGPFAFGCVEPWSRALLEILAFFLALCCFLRGAPPRSRMSADFWIFPAGFAAFGAIQLLAVAPPDAPRPGLPFTAAPHETEAAVLLWASYAAIVWSVPRAIVAHASARRYARLLFASGAALAALGLLQKVTGAQGLYWLRPVAEGSPFGSYYNQDHAANILLMSFCVGVGLLWSTPRKGAGSVGTLRAYLQAQALLCAGLGLIVAGLAACGSRGAFLAVPLAGAVASFLWTGLSRSRGRRRWRSAAALAVAAGVIFLIMREVESSFDAGAVMEWSIAARLTMYGDAWRWLRDSPLFGTGLGSFSAVYPAYQDSAIRGLVTHAHSDWLELALETGALGFCAAAAAALLLARRAARVWRQARSSEMRAVIGGALAAAAAFYAHSLLDFCFQIPGNASWFFAVAGLLLSAPAWADKSADSPRPQASAPGPALAAAACFFILGWNAARPAVAAWQAGRGAIPGDRTASLARGFTLDGDSRLLRELAIYSLRRSAGDESPAAAREALIYALAALQEKPFDHKSLYLAGAALTKLGRAADGRELLERSLRVRFIDSRPVEPGPAQRSDDIEALRRLDILPRAFEAK